MHDYPTGIENKNHKVDYDHMKAKPILLVNIETGKVLVDRMDELGDRFGVVDDDQT